MFYNLRIPADIFFYNVDVEVPVEESVTGVLFLVDTGKVCLNFTALAVKLMCPDNRAAASEEITRFDAEL